MFKDPHTASKGLPRLKSKSSMPHTTYDTDHSRGNRRPANEMQEVSDTETIDHEYPTQDTEISDDETIDHEPTDLEDQSSACHEVFETTELLEHIICFLPMKKIFTMQGVAKQWRDIIATSPSIEEKMFLRLKIAPK